MKDDEIFVDHILPHILVDKPEPGLMDCMLIFGVLTFVAVVPNWAHQKWSERVKQPFEIIGETTPRLPLIYSNKQGWQKELQNAKADLLKRKQAHIPADF